MTKVQGLQLKKQPIVIGEEVPQTKAERLKSLKRYLADELAEKYPCQEYVSDLKLSIEALS